MDFETFKKNFEAFTKIDTPEKLAICERQYKSHILHLEDEKYFEPVTERESGDIISKYYKGIRQILKIDNIKESEFSFLIQPSFEPESLLTFTRINDTYSLIYQELESNYWAKVYTNNALTSNIETSQINLSGTIGEKLFDLLNQTVDRARKPSAPCLTLDGVKYFLSRRGNGEIMTVTKHSPDENSGTGKIISILTALTDYTKTADAKYLDAISVHLNKPEN